MSYETYAAIEFAIEKTVYTIVLIVLGLWAFHEWKKGRMG